MQLDGELFVGSERVRTQRTFSAFEATSGRALQPLFFAADADVVNRACELAWSAFAQFRALDVEVRARFLEAIANQIMALGDALLTRAAVESGLPIGRLSGERARTVNQLRLFAAEVRRGGWLGIRVDPALPDRQPLERSDLRQYKVPLGPVAVFGASNFPLAFAVAGGDTAAALGAGCPVVVKGHPAHPGTSELVAQAIIAATQECAMPEGVFSLLNGESHTLGAELVRHPRIQAVGFTGSRAGGLALMNAARQRPQPIPVFAEMSSINPVVLLPGALAVKPEELAQAFVGSLTLGTGQFCTNPGFVIGLDGPDLERFILAAASSLEKITPTTMLTPSIHATYESRIEQLLKNSCVRQIARGDTTCGSHCGRAALFTVDADTVVEQAQVTEEIFGPSSIIVRCSNETDLRRVLTHLEGQLTATLHFGEQDAPLARSLLAILEGKVGRLIANGWPTGVEVSHAIVHGGPFPATSDGCSTSVGTLAIERFLRPVCYQDFPESLLPSPLRGDVFDTYPHRFDGDYRTGRTRVVTDT